MRVQSLGQEDPLEEGMATPSSILAWRIPWTEKPGGLYNPWGRKVLDTTELMLITGFQASTGCLGMYPFGDSCSNRQKTISKLRRVLCLEVGDKSDGGGTLGASQDYRCFIS